MFPNSIHFGKIVVQGGNDFGFSPETAKAMEEQMGAHDGWKAIAAHWEAKGIDVFVVADATPGPNGPDSFDTRHNVKVFARKPGDESYGQRLLSQEIPAIDPEILERSAMGESFTAEEAPMLLPKNAGTFVADLYQQFKAPPAEDNWSVIDRLMDGMSFLNYVNRR